MQQLTIDQALALALEHFNTGRFEQAAEVCRRVLTAAPDRADAWTNLGECLRATDRLDEAADAYRAAIARDPQLAQAHNNLGIVLARQGQLADAETSFRRAIALQPSYSNAHNNLGNVCQTRGQLTDAIAAHRKATALRSDDPTAHSNLLADLAYDDTVTARQWFEEHQRWWSRHGKQSPPSPSVPPTQKRPLRIGFVSPDLRRHSVAYFLLPLFDHHDRTRFEFHCYADVVSPDEFTQQFLVNSKQLRLTPGVPDSALRDLIRQDGIDVLIDLAGHTAQNRMTLFAMRAAPVQITWLGYPATTGLKTMDYRITDSLADPIGATESLHTEKLLRLDPCAWCYRPPVVAPNVAPLPFQRNDVITFGSFNNLSKISSTTIRLWSDLLHAVSNARLILKSAPFDDESIRRRMLDRFAACNVSSDRITFRGRDAATADHLARYRDIDIALDTYPYCGTTTTCEALHMGVPVVTLAGSEHRSRVGVSLLTSAGLPDLIAPSPDHFTTVATALVGDSSRLTALRQSLRDRLAHSPLRDEQSFTRSFERLILSAANDSASAR